MTACGWAITRCGCGDCWSGYSPAQQARAETLAVNTMWAATGRRYGLCELTVLPCNPAPAEALYQTFPLARYSGSDPFSLGAGGPFIRDGQWFNRGCGSGCSCATNPACQVELPGPVHDIVDVFIDGEEVTSGYEVHDAHLLVRTDGTCWPTCQVFGQEIPGFQVTYHRGQAIPPAVQGAAEIMACEYAKACTGGACRLPPRLVSLTRQGAQVDVAPDIPDTSPGKIRTGIAIVDAVIEADNPYGLVERPQVFSPDMPVPRVVTWASGS